MIRCERWTATWMLTALLSASAPTVGVGQIIPLRTVPVASGDQFFMLPSNTVGMAGVEIAVDDALADPWTNPAKGTLVDETAFLGSPTFYSISQHGGGGRTFPVAGLVAGTTWFGGAAAALQQIENPLEGAAIVDPWFGTPSERLSDRFSRNLYSSVYIGRTLGDSWSIGIGASAASLHAMDGVDLLYAGADRIEQSGSIQDVRVGLRHRSEQDRIALLLLHSRISMKHDVTFSNWVWDPLPDAPALEERVEKNEDRTRTWGAQMEWDRSLRAPGWRIGASGTVNRKSHPKIPNYSIQNIPRDPGDSWAYEAAVGLARTVGVTTFGLDLAFQPIWSETWQEADSADVAASGGALELGARSIENDFFFTNVMLRTGLSHEVGKAVFQAGLAVRSYAYTLEQVNHVEDGYREQTESWMEWMPTFGVILRFADLDVRYAGRISEGTGRPGSQLDAPIGILETVSAAAGGDFLVAPNGPLTLQDVEVVTHQLSVRIPVR